MIKVLPALVGASPPGLPTGGIAGRQSWARDVQDAPNPTTGELLRDQGQGTKWGQKMLEAQRSADRRREKHDVLGEGQESLCS